MKAQIQTTNISESLAVIKTAVAMGYQQYYDQNSNDHEGYVRKNYREYPFPVVDFDDKTYTLSNSNWLDSYRNGPRQSMSMTEFLLAITGQHKKTSVKINDQYAAVANEDFSGVKVGCTFVKKDTVAEILDMLNKKGGNQ